MTDLLPFLKIFPVLLLALMSPGPNFILISNLSLAKGRSAGISCAAAMATVDFIFSGITLLGLGLLLQQAAQLMMVLKILGGLYLLYLGFIIWRSTLNKKNSSESHAPSQSEKRHRNSYLLGFVTSITNPKTIVFYGSIFTLAIDPATDLRAKIMLPLFCALTSLLWYGFVAVALSVPRLRARYQKWSKLIDRGTGTILLLFGAKLILSGRP